MYTALLLYYFSLYRCLKFPADDYCSQYNSATNDYIFQYTSVENMTKLSNDIQRAKHSTNIQGFSFKCQLSFNLFLCNYASIPCNLTTGTPKPICSKSCYYFYHSCPEQYNLLYNMMGYPFMNDCNNTVRQWYRHEVSSDDIRDECLDFGLESKFEYSALLNTVFHFNISVLKVNAIFRVYSHNNYCLFVFITPVSVFFFF